jgi:ankyrin repeat protein
MKNLIFGAKFLISFIVSVIFSTSVLTSSALAANQSDLWFYITNDKDSDVQALLKAGLNPNTINNKQQPALMQAVRDQAMKTFDVLLANPKTDVNLENQFGETALMYVALLGDTTRAQRLIARGAKVNKEGWTPLHYASTKGEAAMVKLLLSNGALPNDISPEGNTALFMAVQTDSLETVQLLINAGADPSASNLKAQDSIDMARLKGKEALARALEKVVQERKLKQRQAQ